MMQRGLIMLLLRPSFLSGVCCVVLTMCILAVYTWDVVSGSVPLANTGVGALVAAAIDTIAWIDAGFTIAFSQPWMYYVVLLGAAAAIACAIYIGLQVATGFVANVEEVIDEAHLSGKSVRRTFGEALGERLVLRVIMACAIVGFWYITGAVLLPYALGLWNVAFPLVLSSWQGFTQATGVVLGMCCMWHVYVVLFRLILLRPRVFGGAYQIMDVL